MRRATKYRIYPTPDQETTMVGWLGQLRFVWNWLLADNITYHEETKKFKFRNEMKKLLPGLKKQLPWLDAPAHAFQNKVFALDAALRRCVVDKTNGFPRFRAKHLCQAGIRLDQVHQYDADKKPIPGKEMIQLIDNNMKLPKIGEIEFVRHREPLGRLTSVTIKREADHWYAVCLFDIEDYQDPATSIDDDRIIGLDMGLKQFFASSDGEIKEIEQHYRKAQKRLARLQRRLSKAQKGGKNREKRRLKVARQHRKVTNKRRDFHHQTAAAIAKQSDVVCCEDLNIKGMKRNLNLGKSISDAGWGSFLLILEDKLNRNGGWLQKIGRFFPSSQLCHKCGHRQSMPLGMNLFDCERCDHVGDRDVNAAINIRREGIDIINRAGIARIYACGDTSGRVHSSEWASQVSLKQEQVLEDNLSEAPIPLGSG